MENGLGYTDARNDPELAIAKKVGQDDGLFFIGTTGRDEVIGTVMCGYDGHRGWIYSLAVSPDHQRSGVGRELMETAEDALIRLGCMKINLQIFAGNGDVERFYQKLGYQTEARISMGKAIPENVKFD